MTEPLGQSQVLPYLSGLRRMGVAVEILSFEPSGTSPLRIAEARAQVEASGIEWQSLVRSPSHAVGRKAWEITHAFSKGLSMALMRRPDIVHARSYVPAVAADAITRVVPRTRFLFDLRGMLGDEYVEGGNWTRDSLRYRALKLYERRLLRNADGVVVLSGSLRRYLEDKLVPAATPIRVIPCCVDTERFHIDLEARAKSRALLGLEGRTIVVYSGTLGAWYRAREMAAFVAALKRRRSDVAWLVLTQADPSELIGFARGEGMGSADVVVRRALPSEMPSLLTAGDVGVSLIRPCFSKMGSSPTKVAEYLACGLITVVNDGVGDMGDLAGDEGCVVLPASFDNDAIEGAAAALATAIEQPYPERSAAPRRVALERYSLQDVGVPAYADLYGVLASGKRDVKTRAP